MHHERVFHMEINPDAGRPIGDALNAIFTLKGSGVGPGNPISHSLLFSRKGRLVAHDNATVLPTGVSPEAYIAYFRNNSFQEYLTALRKNKKALHDLHMDEKLGGVVASSYRFKHWLITIKNYDADGVSSTGHISTVNTLIVLSPLKNLKIEMLEEMIDELDKACAAELNKFPGSVVPPTSV